MNSLGFIYQLSVLTRLMKKTPTLIFSLKYTVKDRFLLAARAPFFLRCAQIGGCSDSAGAEESYLRATSNSTLISSSNPATNTTLLTIKRSTARIGKFNRYT